MTFLGSTLHYVVNVHNLLKCVMRYPKRNKFLIFVSECFRNLLEMKKLCLILSSQQDLWELTTSSPPKHTQMLTVTSETSKSEKSKFLINAWIFFKLACEDSPYRILFMNGIWLDLPLEILWKLEKMMSNSDFRHNLVDLSQIFYKIVKYSTQNWFYL